MNAFNNHTNVHVNRPTTHSILSSLVGELAAAEEILDTVRPFLNLSQLLHIKIDLQARGVVEQHTLRAPERQAVLALARSYQPAHASLHSASQDLVQRLRTVAGQSIVKPPALDLEAANHIEQLEQRIAELLAALAPFLRAEPT
jgi:hypothetical protein